MLSVSHVIRRFVRSEWGGTESAVLHLAKEGIRTGHHHKIYSTSMLSHPGQDAFDSVPIERYAYTFPWFGLSDHDRHLLELKGGNPISFDLMQGLYREPKVDVIHAHVLHRLGGVARSIAKWRQVPFVVSLHGGNLTLPQEVADQMKRPFKGKLEWGKVFGLLVGSRRTLVDADAIVCVGKDEWEKMSEKYPHKRIEYVPNGVDVEYFQSGDPDLFRQTHGIKNPYFLCISRIDPQKNQKLLVEAFAAFPNHSLVLMGPQTVPQYSEELRQLAFDLGVSDRLHLIDGVGPQDPLLISAYKGAEAFVLPSLHEPFGIVILEAWAAGIPVIASSVGGIPGFVTDEKDALLFPSGDKDALIDRMKQVDRSLAAEGARSVQNYSWPVISQQMHQLYSSLR